MSGFRITEVWAFVSVDPADGDEGVCSYQLGDVHWPMIAADHDRLESLRPMAEQLARASGLTIELRKYSTVELVETFRP